VPFSTNQPAAITSLWRPKFKTGNIRKCFAGSTVALFRITGLGKSGEYALPRTNKFSEGNHERDFVSVLVQAGERYAVPRDVSLTSCYIPCEPMLMNVPQVFRHHDRQLPTNQLLSLVAKNLLNSRISKQNVALVVDGEYCQR